MDAVPVNVSMHKGKMEEKTVKMGVEESVAVRKWEIGLRCLSTDVRLSSSRDPTSHFTACR